jgi:hypothetical protein
VDDNDQKAIDAAHKEMDRQARKMWYSGALDGDQGFGRRAIAQVSEKIKNSEKLDEWDSYFLRSILVRLYNNPQAMNVICGVSNKRGKQKDGQHGTAIAASVLVEMRNNKISAEESWERVAEQNHLSASAVKKHWMRWKDTVISSMDAVRAVHTAAAGRAAKTPIDGPTE